MVTGFPSLLLGVPENPLFTLVPACDDPIEVFGYRVVRQLNNGGKPLSREFLPALRRRFFIREAYGRYQFHSPPDGANEDVHMRRPRK